ncbi:MAG: hypothetical protein ACXADO_01640 [Candidatus Thorarchaeota archaeon]
MKSDREPDLVQSILDAILEPHLVYRTGFSVRRATHSSIIAGLLMIAAVQTFVIDTGLAAFFVLLALAFVFMFACLIDLCRAFFFIMSAESDRRMGNVVLANSLMTEGSNQTLTDFRTYNIRVLETSSTKSVEPSFLAIIVSLIVSTSELWFGLSPELIRYGISLLEPVAVIGPISITLILFWTEVILFTGVVGLVLFWYSRKGVSRWSKWTDNELYLEAERVTSKHPIEVQKTFQEAMSLLLAARTGDPKAQEEMASAARKSKEKSAQAMKAIQILRITIILVMIIDALVFLLL